jgi:FMNH2-dependent dimethyl sulfone monooxygenase
MFGVDIREHDERYAYTEEWLTVVERMWSEEEAFDFEGRFFSLKGVKSAPKPYFGDRPILVSAGNSPVGRDFALRRTDCVFMGTREIDQLAAEVSAMTAVAPAPRMYFGCGNLLCRPTRKEAEEFYYYIVHENGDWVAVEEALAMRSKGGASSKLPTHTKERMIFASGTYPFVGSYDDVVEEFRQMAEAGMDGVALGMVNYIDDLPAVRDEVLPRMERLGLREPSA